MKLSKNIFNSAPSSKTPPDHSPKGSAGFDNPRENIDPIIKTFAIRCKEIFIETVGTVDPQITFRTNAHGIRICLDEAAANDDLEIIGTTPLQNTEVCVKALDGENASLRLYSGLTYANIYFHSNEDLHIKNTVQDKDIIFNFDDGGVAKIITIDASANNVNFGDTSIETTGNITGALIYGDGANLTNMGDALTAGEGINIVDETISGENATYTNLGLSKFAVDGFDVTAGRVERKTLAASIYRTAVQSIPNATWTAINFTVELVDTSGFHDNVTNNNRITFPVAGFYFIAVNLGFASNAVGYRGIRFKDDNGFVFAQIVVPPTTGADTDLSLVSFWNVNAAQWIECEVYQTSTAALNVSVNNFYTPRFSVARVAKKV